MSSSASHGTRILVAIPSLGAGGAERVVSTLCNHWAQAGRQIVIATFEAPADAPFYSLDSRIRVERLNLAPVSSPKWRAILHTFKRIAALRRLIRHERPDVVISFLTKMNVMTAQAADGLGIPVIISERNNPYVQKFDRFWNTARALTFPKAFAFVTMTEGAARFFPEKQRPRTTIIPNPVKGPASLRQTAGGSVLTAVGRLTSQKRFDRLIEAFALIEADHPDWTLVIWGEGELRADLEALRDRLGLQNRISLPGLTATPGEWLQSADVLALSSDYEGWPNVVIEALAGGVPVVATDCEFGVTEILRGGELGLIAARTDLKAYAGALARMMSDAGLRRTFAANGIEAAKQYSPETVAAQWDALISAATGRRSG